MTLTLGGASANATDRVATAPTEGSLVAPAADRDAALAAWAFCALNRSEAASPPALFRSIGARGAGSAGSASFAVPESTRASGFDPVLEESASCAPAAPVSLAPL